MGIEYGFELLNNTFTNTSIVNINWIVSIIFVIFTLLIITRDVNKWKTLALPVTILWHIIGIKPSFILYAITGIIFIVNILSIELIGNILEVINKKNNNLLNKIRGKK